MRYAICGNIIDYGSYYLHDGVLHWLIEKGIAGIEIHLDDDGEPYPWMGTMEEFLENLIGHGDLEKRKNPFLLEMIDHFDGYIIADEDYSSKIDTKYRFKIVEVTDGIPVKLKIGRSKNGMAAYEYIAEVLPPPQPRPKPRIWK